MICQFYPLYKIKNSESTVQKRLLLLEFNSDKKLFLHFYLPSKLSYQIIQLSEGGAVVGAVEVAVADGFGYMVRKHWRTHC